MANVAVAAAAETTTKTTTTTITQTSLYVPNTSMASACTSARSLGTLSAVSPSDPMARVVHDAPIPLASGRARGSMKGKHLMRSQALRESASPPRAPSESRPTSSVVVVHTQSNQSVNVTSFAQSTQTAAASNRHSSPKFPPPPSSKLSVTTGDNSDRSLSPADSSKSPSFLDHEFPKLALPKSKHPRNAGSISVQSRDSAKSSMNSNENKKSNLLEVSAASNGQRFASATALDKENRGSTDGDEVYSGGCSPDQHRHMDRHGGGRRSNRSGGHCVKGSKPRLKSMGSSASTDEVHSSGFTSRDDSFEYTDANGIDLIQFFKDTLNKSIKDRSMLMRIEKDLMDLIADRSRSSLKFGPTSSYNRMLIHRVAAFFGMDHNVDATQQCVIAGVSKSTRLPDVRFNTLTHDEEPRKSILKRDTQSFDEYRRGVPRNPDYRMLDRKARSFDVREEEHERPKLRIFKKRDLEASDTAAAGYKSTRGWPNWGGSDSCSEQDGATPIVPMGRNKSKNTNRMLKVHSLSVEHKTEKRPPVTKSHSFGGYGPGSGFPKGYAVTRLFSKQDSLSTSWRLSQSSSGYKTQTQSIRSDSVTPSPTGYESGGEQTPEPLNTCGVVWAVTDMAAVPPGSVLIDPHTLKPMINKDGSIYHFDPDNLPETQKPPSTYRKKMQRQKSMRKTSDQNDNDRHISVDTENIPTRSIDDAQEHFSPGQYSPTEFEVLSHHQQANMSPTLHYIDGPTVEIESTLENDDEPPQSSPSSIQTIGEMHGETLEAHQLMPGAVDEAVDSNIPEALDADGINEFNGLAGPAFGQYTTMYPMDSRAAKSIHHQYVTYQHQDSEQSATGYLVPMYEPMIDGSPHQQSSGPAYPSPSANMASTLLPIAYSPQIFHGGLPPMGPPQHAAIGVSMTAHQMVYGAIESSTITTTSVAGGSNQQPAPPQYITFPMGCPYPYSDPSYPNYWPSNMGYYVPQAVTSEPPHQLSSTSMPPIHYPNVIPSTYPTANNSPNYSLQKRGSPPTQTHHSYQPMSSAQPYSGQTFSPSTGGTTIFSPSGVLPHPDSVKPFYPVSAQTIYPNMVAPYQPPDTPPESNNNSPTTSNSPIMSSPTPSVASTINVLTCTSSPSTPPQLTNSTSPPICTIYTPPTSASPPSPNPNPSTIMNVGAKPATPSANDVPAQSCSPPSASTTSAFPRKPIVNHTPSSSGRFYNDSTSYTNHRRHNSEHVSNYNSHSNHNHVAYQPNKFRTPHIPRRPYGDYSGFQSFQPVQHHQPPLMSAVPISTGSSFQHNNPMSFADKFRATGPRPRPPNLDLRRSGSFASVGSPGAPASDSPNSGGSCKSGDQTQNHFRLPTTASSPATSHHIPHASILGAGGPALRSHNAFSSNPNSVASIQQLQQQQHHHHPQQSFFGAAAAANAINSVYGGAGASPAGMFVKLNGAFFTHHPSISFGNHRGKVFPKEIRPSFNQHPHHAPQHPHLADIFPSMNMMLSAQGRFLNPRSSNTSVNFRNMRPR